MVLIPLRSYRLFNDVLPSLVLSNVILIVRWAMVLIVGGIILERKLVKQGRDALTVTLPSKWLKDKGLKAGQSVYIDIEKNNLIVKSSSTSQFREITVDLRDEERGMIWHKSMGKYVDGYDKIVLLHNNPELVQMVPKMMLGMIIEEHTQSRTVVKSLISTPENNIDIVIRRVVHMFEQQAILLEELAKGKATLNDVKDQETLLDTNIYYCLRYINKYHMQMDSYKHFLLCAIVESAADLVTQISKYIGKDVKLAKTIREGVQSYNKYFFTTYLKAMYTALRSFRNNVKTKTFTEGLAFELAEILYNNIGYLMDREK